MISSDYYLKTIREEDQVLAWVIEFPFLLDKKTNKVEGFSPYMMKIKPKN